MAVNLTGFHQNMFQPNSWGYTGTAYTTGSGTTNVHVQEMRALDTELREAQKQTPKPTPKPPTNMEWLDQRVRDICAAGKL